MGRIAILPPSVADQIAAGEVVERPASVVKELVENALDAGAREVTVELEGGGATLIRVSDDGGGMDADDAQLAMGRHATSKIRYAADLIGVQTYGFRGEALAAIAAVSQVELETALAGASGGGTRVAVSGGELQAAGPTARAAGTTVVVRRLFFNTPARRKFLRSPRSETRAIVEAVTLLALTRLDVAFRVVGDGRVLLDAPRVASVAERAAALFGRRLVTELVPVDAASGALSVRGFVQRPADARPTGRKACLFVNGRPFRDPFLVRAAETGYRATIHPGCRPTMFLALALPGDQLDVNVHPQKLEVRFRDRYVVERAVEEAVRAALQPLEAAAVLRPGAGASPWRVPSFGAGGASAPAPAPAGEDDAMPLFADAPGAPAAWSSVGPLLQVSATYIVFESPDGLSIVDQHSAHERVLYERAMEQLTGGGAAAQHLLLPITVDLEPRALEAVETHADLLRAVGFEAEPFGGRSVIIHAVPNPHPRFDAKRCFEEVVADLSRGRFGGWANRLERFAATYACRAAIKAGQPLASDEMRELVARLMACELPPHDVHGRPTIVQLPREELERRFGRA
ncbi:MAG: DNA mismatch repair endonuclease MutL [Gemmatimonadetes bacterium]|nr:DNA mismatch repair endonuclease MutL [Gemmatimonadota bacterium]